MPLTYITFRSTFIPANHPKASSVNESNVLIVESPAGIYLMRQIAGLIARRIVCDVQVDSPLTQGKRFGIIQFGSGMELYMPPSAVVKVSVGQKVKVGGGSPFGRFLDTLNTLVGKAHQADIRDHAHLLSSMLGPWRRPDLTQPFSSVSIVTVPGR